MHPRIEDHPGEHDLLRAAEMLRVATRVAVLTGAGISAESGIPTFRGADGLWENHRVEDVATPEAFHRDPDLVWRFYNTRRSKLWTVHPNPGHVALARMEERWGRDSFTLCTQNIDGLHRAAGSFNVLELHGNLARVRCTACAYADDRPGVDLEPLPRCPECTALLRPDIVWFHEALPHVVWSRAATAAEECDCLLIVGTSAIVYPAAGLVDWARRGGARLIEVNLEPTEVTRRVDVHLSGKAGEVLPRLLDSLSSP